VVLTQCRGPAGLGQDLCLLLAENPGRFPWPILHTVFQTAQKKTYILWVGPTWREARATLPLYSFFEKSSAEVNLQMIWLTLQLSAS
jgi:hypothetical protein